MPSTFFAVEHLQNISDSNCDRSVNLWRYNKMTDTSSQEISAIYSNALFPASLACSYHFFSNFQSFWCFFHSLSTPISLCFLWCLVLFSQSPYLIFSYLHHSPEQEWLIPSLFVLSQPVTLSHYIIYNNHIFICVLRGRFNEIYYQVALKLHRSNNRISRTKYISSTSWTY